VGPLLVLGGNPSLKWGKAFQQSGHSCAVSRGLS